jgi:hypothetical protein
VFDALVLALDALEEGVLGAEEMDTDPDPEVEVEGTGGAGTDRTPNPLSEINEDNLARREGFSVIVTVTAVLAAITAVAISAFEDEDACGEDDERASPSASAMRVFDSGEERLGVELPFPLLLPVLVFVVVVVIPECDG